MVPAGPPWGSPFLCIVARRSCPLGRVPPPAAVSPASLAWSDCPTVRICTGPWASDLSSARVVGPLVPAGQILLSYIKRSGKPGFSGIQKGAGRMTGPYAKPCLQNWLNKTKLTTIVKGHGLHFFSSFPQDTCQGLVQNTPHP